MKRSIAQFAIACLFALPAHAYVDPGTGSMAIQFIIGGIVAAAFMVKTYYYELNRPIARLFGQDTGYQADGESHEESTRTSDESSSISK